MNEAVSDLKQKFSANRAEDAVYKPGLREFLEYRDLGIEAATHGKVRAHVLRVKDDFKGVEQHDMHTTGPHQHMVDFQMFYVLKGWVKFIYEDQPGELKFSAGDCVLAPPAIRHNEMSCSDDLEVLEILSPAVHDTLSVETVPGHD